MFDESGRINYGLTKTNCIWLALIPQSAPAVPCASAIAPDTYALAADGLFSSGGTCYAIYSNGSTINCQHHIVISQNGGTFAYFKNSMDGKVENCYLLGFTEPIVALNSSVQILNNTIYVNTSNDIYAVGAFAINITDVQGNPYSEGSSVDYNNVSTTVNGIILNGTVDSYILHNFVKSPYTAYAVYNSTGLTVSDNNASNSSSLGMEIANSQSTSLGGNRLVGRSGLICIGIANTVNSNTDLGQNECTSNQGCSWIASSKSTC